MMEWQAVGLYWMGVAAEQSGDMHGGKFANKHC